MDPARWRGPRASERTGAAARQRPRPALERRVGGLPRTGTQARFARRAMRTPMTREPGTGSRDLPDAVAANVDSYLLLTPLSGNSQLCPPPSPGERDRATRRRPPRPGRGRRAEHHRASRMALRYEGFECRDGSNGREALETSRGSARPRSSSTSCCPASTGSRSRAGCATRAQRRADPLPHRPRRHRGQGPRAHARRRRLHDQAVQRRGAGGADPRDPAARAGPPRAEGRLTFADLELDEDTHEVWRAGTRDRAHRHRVQAPPLPAAQPRRVLSRAQILDHVWNYDFGGDGTSLETYISYLRQEGRRRGRAAHPHRARRRLRVAQAEGVVARPTRIRAPTSLRARLDVGPPGPGSGGPVGLRRGLLHRASLLPHGPRRPAGAVGSFSVARTIVANKVSRRARLGGAAPPGPGPGDLALPPDIADAPPEGSPFSGVAGEIIGAHGRVVGRTPLPAGSPAVSRQAARLASPDSPQVLTVPASDGSSSGLSGASPSELPDGSRILAAVSLSRYGSDPRPSADDRA